MAVISCSRSWKTPCRIWVGGQVAEEAFDPIEPRDRGGNKAEVHVESPVHFDPALDPWMVVGRIVVADQVNLLAHRL